MEYNRKGKRGYYSDKYAALSNVNYLMLLLSLQQYYGDVGSDTRKRYDTLRTCITFEYVSELKLSDTSSTLSDIYTIRICNIKV